MGSRLKRLAKAGSHKYHNLCFEQKYVKYQNFYLKIFIFGGKILSIFELACFCNVMQTSGLVFRKCEESFPVYLFITSGLFYLFLGAGPCLTEGLFGLLL